MTVRMGDGVEKACVAMSYNNTTDRFSITDTDVYEEFICKNRFFLLIFKKKKIIMLLCFYCVSKLYFLVFFLT